MAFSKNSKIFITGANGFLGRYIIRQLLHDGYNDIVGLYRLPKDNIQPAHLNPVIQWREGNILDIPFLTSVLEGIDIIIHTAADVHFDLKARSKQLQTAIDGTANIVNIALEKSIKKIIHISSVAAMGRRRESETISEKHIFSHSKYDTSYALSKFLAEQEVWRGHAEGLNTTILNPSKILGAGEWEKSSPQIFKNVYLGQKFYPVGCTGWVDVRDVANAVSKCLETDFNGERFIISAENISYQKVLDTVATKLSVKRPLSPISNKYAPILWRIEALKSFFLGKKPIMTKETILSTSAKSEYDAQKSVEILGMAYRSIENTIQACCVEFLATYQNKEKLVELPVE